MGMEIASFISPVKSAKKLGLIYSNHTDFNVTPLNPFYVMWTASNRITRAGLVLGPNERVDAYTALQGITTGPAWQFFEEDRKGKIKVGMLADFVILKNNPLKQVPADLRENEVYETIKEGKPIFMKTQKSLLGGWEESEVTPEAEVAIKLLLLQGKFSSELKKIVSVKTQIVNGRNYDIDFELENGEVWNIIIYMNRRKPTDKYILNHICKDLYI